MLRISDDVALPHSAITHTFGLLAVRGAGKSNAARVIAEKFFRAGLPFVAIDPVGSWFGLRSSRDGKSPGLPIPIFGGRRGDVPLEREGGRLIADLVVDRRLSCILDISTFESEAAKKGFLLDFARRLFLRNEEPLHLFLEEADDYIPQKPMRDELHLLRAFENIVRRGRARGLGVTLISQRSAVVNKNVLTQVQTLIAMRTTSPQDRAAVEAWLKYHAQSREILESLPSLKDGEAWIWSPTFLKKTVRTRFQLSETFDSGETPKMGKRTAATLADVDLSELTKRMAATIERAKQDDPKELKKRIAELEKQLEMMRSKPAAANELNEFRERGRAMAEAMRQSAANLTAFFDGFGDVRRRSEAAPSRKPRPKSPTVPDGPTDPSVGSGGMKRILIALAQRPQGLSQRSLGLRAGLSSNSGTFSSYLSRARGAGWIEGKGTLRITDAGEKALGEYEPLPTGTALLDYWLADLGNGGASRILRSLADVYPRSLSQEELAERAQLTTNSGTFSSYLSRLRGLELIEGRGELKAADEFFN
jgi:hypothetical protein